ncbi:MAG: hypothetical protein A2049_10490 [Elusimicrobia bacterium GWA2_62_23]|nr:MAG: hypothetical protein A2049_10490 [Elusimicrobia bacterium GWA2_62_23]
MPGDVYAKDRRFLADHFSEQGVMYEGKPEPFEILPYLVPSAQNEAIKTLFKSFHSLLEKTIDLYRERPEIRQYFNFNKAIESMVLLSCRYSPRIHICRFDYTVRDNGFPAIYETNSACPGGLLKMSRIFGAYKRTQLYRDLCASPGANVSAFEYYKAPVFTTELHRLYTRATGKTQPPVVGILNSRHRTLTNEIGLMIDELQSCGLRAVNAYVEDLDYKNGRLVGGGIPLDLCYQKFDDDLSCDYPFTPDTRSAVKYINALRDGSVVGVNSFASTYLVESKAVLGLYWDPRFEGYFTGEEIDLARRITARTELLPLPHDAKLGEYMAKKDSLVLKCSLDTRGRSVVIGRETPQDVWEKFLKQDRTNAAAPYVVQEFHPHEQYEGSELKARYVSHAYFVVAGNPVGMFTRISESSVTNVGKCGKTGISFIV